jgi:hypothetical protein
MHHLPCVLSILMLQYLQPVVAQTPVQVSINSGPTPLIAGELIDERFTPMGEAFSVLSPGPDWEWRRAYKARSITGAEGLGYEVRAPHANFPTFALHVVKNGDRVSLEDAISAYEELLKARCAVPSCRLAEFNHTNSDVPIPGSIRFQYAEALRDGRTFTSVGYVTMIGTKRVEFLARLHVYVYEDKYPGVIDEPFSFREFVASFKQTTEEAP